MSIQAASVSLRLYRPGEGVVALSDLAPLNLDPQDNEVRELVAGRGPGATALVSFFRATLEDYSNSGVDADGAFDTDLNEAFANAGRWILRRPSESFLELTKGGLRYDLFMDFWIDQDQLDLVFAPGLLLACGERNIGIKMITND